jgi:hypothetical protein
MQAEGVFFVIARESRWDDAAISKLHPFCPSDIFPLVRGKEMES